MSTKEVGRGPFLQGNPLADRSVVNQCPHHVVHPRPQLALTNTHHCSQDPHHSCWIRDDSAHLHHSRPLATPACGFPIPLCPAPITTRGSFCPRAFPSLPQLLRPHVLGYH